MSDNILSVKDLRTSFTTDNGEVMAVNGISFNLDKGKILGLSLIHIWMIAPALYPAMLMDISGGYITGRLQDENYDISVVFKPGVKYNTPNIRFIPVPEKFPEFVIEKTSPAQ